MSLNPEAVSELAQSFRDQAADDARKLAARVGQYRVGYRMARDPRMVLAEGEIYASLYQAWAQIRFCGSERVRLELDAVETAMDACILEMNEFLDHKQEQVEARESYVKGRL